MSVSREAKQREVGVNANGLNEWTIHAESYENRIKWQWCSQEILKSFIWEHTVLENVQFDRGNPCEKDVRFIVLNVHL